METPALQIKRQPKLAQLKMEAGDALNEMVNMVTGAASGMGRQFALSLARDGAKSSRGLERRGLASLSEAAKDLAGEVATGVGNGEEIRRDRNGERMH